VGDDALHTAKIHGDKLNYKYLCELKSSSFVRSGQARHLREETESLWRETKVKFKKRCQDNNKNPPDKNIYNVIDHGYNVIDHGRASRTSKHQP
jgi:hypothetical protein